MAKQPTFIPLPNYVELPVDEMRRRAAAFRDRATKRRTVRDFSDRSVPRDLVLDCLEAAASAPSGANLQPWHFVVIEDRETKRRIRKAAELEEREFYERRALQAKNGSKTLKVEAYCVPENRRAVLEDLPWSPATFERNHKSARMTLAQVVK